MHCIAEVFDAFMHFIQCVVCLVAGVIALLKENEPEVKVGCIMLCFCLLFHVVLMLTGL